MKLEKTSTYKTKQKKDKGITLVALLITIIILVIITAVSLSAIYESRVIDYATNGAENYIDSSSKENAIIEGTAERMDNSLDKINGILGIREPFDEETLKMLIGSYVNYKPTSDTYTLNKNYSGHTSNIDFKTNTNVKWQILRVDNNKMTLIASDIANSKFYLRSYQGYNNGVKLLNDACSKLYNNSDMGTVARSLKIEDIEAVSSYVKQANTEYTPSYKCYPAIFAEEKTGYVNTGYGTRYNQSQQDEFITQSEETEADTLKGKRTYYSYELSSYMTEEYAQMFGYKAGSDNNLDYYWLASRCVNIDNSYANFNMFYIGNAVINHNSYYLYTSDANTAGKDFGLRPVVEIDLSKVKVGNGGNGTADEPYTISKK